MTRPVGILLAAVVAACTSVPTPSGTAAPATAPGTVSPAATTNPSTPPTASPQPSAPHESAAHLRSTKAKTNLPPRVAHWPLQLATRSQGTPRYVGVDGFRETWRSNDGVTWQMAANPDRTPSAWTTDIVTLGDQLLAFDRFLDYTGPSSAENGPFSALSDGKTWLSSDGRTWSSHPSPFAFVYGIVDGDRLVATGGVAGDDLPTFATSADGVTWTLAAKPSGPWPGGGGCTWSVRSITGSGDDVYVVVAVPWAPAGTPCGEQTGRLWRSADLASWVPVTLPGTSCPYAYDVVRGPRGFVAVGASLGPGGSAEKISCAWVSADGVTWRPATVPPPVVTNGSRQLAIAPDGTFLDYGDAIWESTDGLQWYLSAPGTNVYVNAIAGDLAIGCGRDTCDSLRMAVP